MEEIWWNTCETQDELESNISSVNDLEEGEIDSPGEEYEVTVDDDLMRDEESCDSFGNYEQPDLDEDHYMLDLEDIEEEEGEEKEDDIEEEDGEEKDDDIEEEDREEKEDDIEEEDGEEKEEMYFAADQLTQDRPTSHYREASFDTHMMQYLYDDEEEEEEEDDDDATADEIHNNEFYDCSSSFAARSYQVELFEHAKRKNSILVLGTGTGKTFISILLIKELAESIRGKLKDGAKRTVFLVNTVPLVHQQAKAIEQHTSFKVGWYEGSMGVDIWSPEQWSDELNKNEVLVMVAQIFLDLILAARLCFTEINLIIMDECHHATGNHPMREIMREYNEVKKRKVEVPRIMGLTACIIHKRVVEEKVVGLMRELEAVMDSVLVTSQDQNTVRQYGTKAKLLIVKCKTKEQPPTFNHVKKELQTIFTNIEERIEREKKFTGSYRSKVQKLVKKQISGIMDITTDLGDYVLLKAIKLQSEFLEEADVENIYEKNLLVDLGESLKDLHSKSEVGRILNPTEYLSTKVLRLLEILGQCSKDTCTLVFVTRRNTAKLLTSLLLELRELDHSLAFLLPEFVVGGNLSSKFDMKIAREEIRKQKETIDRFRKGECNLIVSTSVLEEGIDVRKCNLVVRYNEPPNYRSYIQSLGRARAVPSYYITLIEESKVVGLLESYNCFRRIDDHLNSLCHNRDVPTTQEIQHNFDKDEKEPPFAPFGLPGAHITFNSSIQLINRYCGTLPQDKFTNLQVAVNKVRTKGGKYIIDLTLPMNAPYRKSVCGNPMQNCDDAKKSAALNMCRTLFKLNLLDSSLLPKKMKVEAEEGLKKYLKVSEEGVKGKPQPGTMKRRQVYQRHICKALKGECETLNLYLIYFQHIESLQNGLILDSDSCGTRLGIICRNKLNCCSFPLYSDKWGKVNIIIEFVKEMSGDSVIMDDVKQFHNVASQLYLDLNMEILRFNPESGPCAYIVPITKSKEIDASMLKALKHPNQGGKGFEKAPILLNGDVFKFEAQKYENGVIFPRYRELEMFYVDKVLYDQTPLSPFPESKKKFSSYKDYVKKEYDTDISTDDQPMLDCKHFSKEFNYLAEKKATTKVHQSRHPSFIPELCFLLPCAATFWCQVLCVASILYRINGLEIEQELFAMINFPGNEDKKKFRYCQLDYSWVDNAVDEILVYKPSETNLCVELRRKRRMVVYPGMFLQALTPLNTKENFNLERLELLGDSYLKFIIGLYLFCKEYSSNEGMLSIQRSRLVSNKTLYLLAKKKGIANMYQGVLLRQQTAIPYGFEVPDHFEKRIKKEKVPAEEWSSYSKKGEGLHVEEAAAAPPSGARSKGQMTANAAEQAFNPWREQLVPDKCVADCVEALIAACLVSGGEEAAKHFMHWLGFNFIAEETTSPKTAVVGDLPEHRVHNSLSAMYKRYCLDRLEQRLNYTFKEKSFLLQAVTHPSYLNNKVTDCYQRLEFLGDAILDYLIAGYIFNEHRKYSPGQLTDLKSHYVKNETLAKVCVKFEFHKYLLHMSSKLESSTAAFMNMLTDGVKDFNTEEDTIEAEDVEIPKALGDVVEALIGAVYVDSGNSLAVTWAVIELLLRDEFEATKTEIPIDSVRELYERDPEVKIRMIAPTEEEKAKCIIKMRGFPELTGCGKNKRTAKQAAAKLALSHLDNKLLAENK